nr:hypothetical protein [Tanacetum cinerariifolium]
MQTTSSKWRCYSQLTKVLIIRDNTNVESFSSFQILNQESKPRQEEIDVVSETNDVLPPRDDDSDDEVDIDGDLRVDNVIQNSKHEYSERISVQRNLIVKFECIDARMKFDVKNDVFKFIMFSLLSAKSEDTIFDLGIESSPRLVFYLVCACLCCDLSRIISQSLKISYVGYCPGFQDPS